MAQQGIWFTERAFDVGTAYRMPFAVHVGGPVDLDRLRQAAERVTARHPLLSAAVEERDGVPYFVASECPLCTITVEPRPGGATVSVDAHHLVFDGGSKDVFVRDLAAAYRGTLDPGPVAIPTEDEPDLEAAQEFWARHWHGHDDLTLPGLRESDDPAADSVPLDLSCLDADRFGVTRFELLTAAWFALLHRYGNENAVVAVDLGTRDATTRDAIGPFVNELPVACGRFTSFRELAAEVRARLRALYPFRAVPLGRAVPGLAPRPSIAPTSISYRRRAADPVFDGLTTTVDWMLGSGALRATAHLQAVDGPAGIDATLRYRTACLDRAAATRVAEDLRALLAEVTATPECRLAGPTMAVPDATVADLVSGAPDAVAVVGADGTRLTYAELDAWAGRIAEELRGHGVGPGSLVGVSLRRSPAMVATVLGVWRAGVAYVPLDPDYPEGRLTYMLEDSGAALLVDEQGMTPLATDRGTAGLAYVIYTSGSTGRPKGVGSSRWPPASSRR